MKRTGYDSTLETQSPQSIILVPTRTESLWLPVKEADPTRHGCQQQFEITQELGKGSFGTVSQVTAEDTTGQWVMKIVNVGDDPFKTYNAMKEASIQKYLSFQKAWVPKVFDLWVCDGSVYVVMEKMDRTLKQMLEGVRQSLPHGLLESMKDLCDNLGQHGVLHGDLKPDNIMWHIGQKHLVAVDFGYGQLNIPLIDDFGGWLTAYAPVTIRQFLTKAASYNLWQLEKAVILFHPQLDFDKEGFGDMIPIGSRLEFASLHARAPPSMVYVVDRTECSRLVIGTARKRMLSLDFILLGKDAGQKYKTAVNGCVTQ